MANMANLARTAHLPPTVLVIDDDVNIQMIAAQSLRNEGFQVLVAADTQEALAVAEEFQGPIDVLLTDVMLPSGNGMSLARAFLNKRPNTPILYMSGFHADAIQSVQKEGGPNGGFLEKPFTPRVLVERIRGLLPSAGQDFPRPESASRPVAVVTAGAEPSAAAGSDAVYRLESPVRCPQCGETISTLKAVRLLRMQVNFTSTLPRRGRVVICPCCMSVVPAELTNF
jgi:DNA-binding response OmpR family regulator